MKAPRPRRNSAARSAALVGLLLLPALAYASAGTISSVHRYAWSNVGGWVNFAPTNATVTVTDSTLTGYAWSANDGWINLSGSQSGVTNDGKGNLGGFAWDSSTGWVSFTGVTIDSSGRFHGEATGASGYAINFDCSSCDVETSWRPVTVATNPSPGAISPIAPVNNTVLTAPTSPMPVQGPKESAPIPSPVTQVHSVTNADSIMPRASSVVRSATSTTGTTRIFARILRQIAIPVAVVLFFTAVAAIFWFF